MIRPPPISTRTDTLFPSTTPFRSSPPPSSPRSSFAPAPPDGLRCFLSDDQDATHMGDLNIIDQFLAAFVRYIDSGFGLLGGNVSFLSRTLIALDITLAGLFWADRKSTRLNYSH